MDRQDGPDGDPPDDAPSRSQPANPAASAAASPNLEEVLERSDLPDDVRAIVLEETKHQRFSGPIPPPELLAQYDRVLPGAAERIVAMAERQAEHRMSLENKVLRSEDRRTLVGQGVGAIVVLGLAALAAAMAFDGREVAAAALGSTDLGLIGAVFVLGRRRD